VSSILPGLGVDFGGVIAQNPAEPRHHPAEGDPTAVDPVAGAFDALLRARDLFADRVWVVSKASSWTEDWTWRWLAEHRFTELTGIPSERIIFVREHEGKLDVCRRLGIQYFVDDQVRNLEILQAAVAHLYLFGDSVETEFERVCDWPEALGVLEEALSASGGAPSN
jgi:hypothetical protein